MALTESFPKNPAGHQWESVRPAVVINAAILALCTALNSCANKAVQPVVAKPAAAPLTTVQSPQKDCSIICDNREYRDGEVIEMPVGRILVQGWQLLFERDPEFEKKFPAKNFNFYVFDSYGTHFFAGQPVAVDNRKYEAFPVVPDPILKEVHLTLLMKDHGTDEQSRVFRIKLPVFHTGDSYLTSEVDLGGENIKKLNSLIEGMYKFTLLHPRVVVRNFRPPMHRMECGQLSNGTIFLCANAFKNSHAPDEGLMFFFHEYSHFLMDNKVRENVDDQQGNNDFNKAYHSWLKGAGFTGRNWEEVCNHPNESILREDSYFNLPAGVKEVMGHPEDSYLELFASILTVLRFYPQEFIKRFSALDADGKKNAAQVVKVALESLKLKEEDLLFLIPQIRQIRTALKI